MRQKIHERKREGRKRDSEGERKGWRGRIQGEYKEGKQVNLFHLQEQKELKKKKKVSDSEKESVGSCFHEQAA